MLIPIDKRLRDFIAVSVFLAFSVLGIPGYGLTSHTVNFGGTYGYGYSPKTLTVEVGDTIVWKGDFTTYPLESVSLPPGAKPLGPVNSGTSFSYIAGVGGTYNYQNKIYAPIGMTGSITAVYLPHGGMTNEGREFFLGMLYPSYNYVAIGKASGTFAAMAIITTYYDNDVTVSYFTTGGEEVNKIPYKVPARRSLQISLNVAAMQMDTSAEASAFKSCHITSKYPVSVQYLSSGVNCGGSYLALPALALGKNYVISSYNDNAGDGALYGGIYGGYYYPKDFDPAGGQFLIIGTEGQTGVTIIPTTTTTGGHTGVRTGAGATGAAHPYTISLGKGECYLVRSNGLDPSADISGSIVTASKPIVVIAGHEDAGLGGVDPYTMEARDFMIEQMTPVEFWDSVGYLSIPLVEASTPGTEGHGDSYRVYTYDTVAARAQMDVLGISGGYSMATSRLSTPPQKFDITDPVDIYTTNGKKISVMQYDERSQTDKSPTPAPSMVTVVPKSRWRKEYNFSVQLPAQIFGVTDNQFMNIISDSLNDIKVSVDGGPEKNLVGNVTNMKTYASVSKQYSLKGAQYRIGAGSYYLHSDYPFIAYVYGMNQLEPWGFGGSYYWTYETEFATTGGMQLNTGIVPNFAVSIDSCSAWHVCIRDTGKNDPGIKAVILIDDPDGVYFDKVGLKYNNTSLDTGSTDYVAGELHPHWHSSQAYCFDVSLPNPLAPAMAPLAIIDNLGNTSILVLSRSASPLKLSTNPPTSGRADSIVFPVQKIGSEVCTTFVFKNTAAVGSPAINLNSAVLHGGDPSFTLQSVTPPLPHAIAAGDSLLMRVCYKPNDSLRHRDSLIVKSDCFTVGISIDAHGSTTGYINAEDLEFGSVTVGKQYCQNVIIHNVGQAPFTLEKSWLLSDTANFSVDTRSGASLPVLIQPGKSFSLGVCFHPRAVGRDSGRIDWSTDLEPQFMHTIKDYSIISGTGIPEIIESVHSSKIAAQTLSIRPNPASGNSAVCYFSEPLQGMATLAIIDILGREISKGPIPTGISKIEIPLRSLHEGIYYIRVTSANGVMTQKLEVTK